MVPQGSSLNANNMNDPWSGISVGDEADAFFDDSYVHEVHLYFDDPNWYDTLYNGHANDTENPYFPAKFVYNNTVLDPVGVRFKGFSSFRSTGTELKKSFRIDFNEYQEDGGNDEEKTFFGLKKLNLNNGFKDPSMLREKLFWDFASHYMITIRAVHTRLYINDEYYGLYTAVEQIDHTFIESRFGTDENGNLYKVESGTLANIGLDHELYNGPYELRTNLEENNWSDLIELTYVLTNVSLLELPSQLEPIFDVKSGLFSLALLNIFSSLDSYLSSGRNYYLYDRDDTGQFTFLLWDANEAFGRFTNGMRAGEELVTLDPFWFPAPRLGGPPPGLSSPPRGSILLPLGLPPPEGPPSPPPGGLFASRERPLMTNLMEIASYNRTYLRSIAQMLREGFNPDTFNTRVQELADIIRDDVYSDPNLLFPTHNFEVELTHLVNFVEERVAYLDNRLNDFSLKTDLKLNDLMSVNLDTITDSEGEYSSWVEIYNMGPGLITTDNIFLSDDPNIPSKWQVPIMDLDDGHFLLLCLNTESNKDFDNIPFNLNPNGGDLYLYTYDELDYMLIDNVSYPTLDAGVSYGRFPDGEMLWLEMNDYTTPATSNRVDAFPNYLFINEFMADNDITVMSPDGSTPDWIELFNAGYEIVDLSSMYLTDDLTDPTSWQFPNGTLIDPGGYLVVWADDNSDTESLHASFKLNANGEEIGLFGSDGETLIDSIVFFKQIQDVSYGRIPDGSSNWDYLPTSSLGLKNEKNLSDMASSVWSILVLVTLVILAFILVVFGQKISKKNEGNDHEK